MLSNMFTATGVDDIGLHLLYAASPLAAAPKTHQEIKVDPKLFDGYVGRYLMNPSFILTITRDEDRLYVQATGQPQFEIFPKSEREFYLKVVDAQITFETDAKGEVSRLILHQNGSDRPATKMR